MFVFQWPLDLSNPYTWLTSVGLCPSAAPRSQLFSGFKNWIFNVGFLFIYLLLFYFKAEKIPLKISKYFLPKSFPNFNHLSNIIKYY